MTSMKLLLAVFAVSLLQCIPAQDAKCEVSTKPAFSAPGRRLSEEKCREYNWEKNKIECKKGDPTTKYPYLGLVGYKREGQEEFLFACLSTLISPEFVLTGAHCVRVPASSNLSGPEIVRFRNSETNIKLAPVDSKVVSTIVHPEYKPPQRYFDIALVKIEKVTFSNLDLPACLWSQNLVDVGEYVAPGPGAVKGAPFAEMLLRVLDEKACKAGAEHLINRHWGGIKDHQICANETFTSERQCVGTGGGPMVKLVKLDSTDDEMPYALGVTSFGSRMCTGIGIYTRVSSFLDWIETTVWKTL